MTDLSTTIHNVPPAAVAAKLRGRYQWAAYQALAAAAGAWVTADDLLRAVYGDDFNSWEPQRALKSVVARLRVKGIPIQTHVELYGRSGSLTRYCLPLKWQREQDGAS